MLATDSQLSVSKIKLYLKARGWEITSYKVADEGKAFKDSNGKFTLLSLVTFTKPGGKGFRTGFRKNADGSAVGEQEAFKSVFFNYLRSNRVHICNRCGGAGGGEQWRLTGYTCFDCGGTGIDPKFDCDKALDKALAGEDWEGDYIAKREARLKAEHKKAERVAAERRQRALEFYAVVVSKHAELYAKLCLVEAQITNKGSDDMGAVRSFLRAYATAQTQPESLCDWGAPEFSDAMITRYTEIVEKYAAKAGSASKYVGVVGVRSEFTGKVKFVTSFQGRFGSTTLTVLEDAEGNVIKYWNSLNGADKGDTVTFTAAVKEHGIRDGVLETTITRATKITVQNAN